MCIGRMYSHIQVSTAWRQVPYCTPRDLYGASQGRFLNVDLDVSARTDLGHLLAAMERKMTVLNAELSPRHSFICAEVNGQPRSAEHAILSFVSILAGLRGKARSQWNRCTGRCFNIGYDSPKACPALQDAVSLEAIRAAASVGASIGISIYAFNEDKWTQPSSKPPKVKGRRGRRFL